MDVLKTNLKGAVVEQHPFKKDAVLVHLETDDGFIALTIERPISRLFIQDLDNSTSF